MGANQFQSKNGDFSSFRVPNTEIIKKIELICVVFSSSSSSYISPNKSPLFVPSTTAGYWANKEPNSPRHFFINSQKFNYSPTQAASSSSAEYSPFLADFIETLPKIASNQQPSTSEGKIF